MRVALVHDWLITYRGGEKVLEAICDLFPEADLYTLLHEQGAMPATIEDRRIKTSFLQRIPGALKRHRHLLPLFPSAVRSLPLDGYDLVLSSSHCVAKGIRKGSARHLSYVHAPMRYMWDRFEDYFGPGRASSPVRAAAFALRPWLRRWDQQTAEGVDHFVANSHYVAGQISRLYGRQASVVHPPVELARFTEPGLAGVGQGGYFLWFGALAPYKRADLAIEAFRRLQLPLWIGGAGQELKRLARDLPPNVRLLGQVPDEDLPSLYRSARALVFTGEEDFGITPLEAQATGRPVIAYGRGGALETVTPRTGLFFAHQTVEALCAAVESFVLWERRFDPREARANALRFSRARFQEDLAREIAQLFPGFRSTLLREDRGPGLASA